MNIWTSRGNGVISLHGLTSPNFSVCPKPGSRFASSSAVLISMFVSFRFARGMAYIVVVGYNCS